MSSKDDKESVPFSASRFAISLFNMLLSSLVLTYFSFATRFSIRSIIFNVVSTPTSEDKSVSSSESNTSASTFDFPVMARAILENKEFIPYNEYQKK